MQQPHRGRVGVFVLSIYADRRTKRDLDRMILWPQGEISVLETLAVLEHLADISQQIICTLRNGAQESEERGPLNEDRLAVTQAKRGKGTRFDATA